MDAIKKLVSSADGSNSSKLPGTARNVAGRHIPCGEFHAILFPMKFQTLILISMVLCAGIPLSAGATLGIAPAGGEATLPQGQYEDRTLSIMRDDADADSEMYISVFSDDGFLVTEGVGYYMHAGDRQITIPYRIDTHTYTPGEYTGVLYVRPERIEATTTAGVRLVVQGGVKIRLTVSEPSRPVSWYMRVLENTREHLAIYRDVSISLAHQGLALVRGVVE